MTKIVYSNKLYVTIVLITAIYLIIYYAMALLIGNLIALIPIGLSLLAIWLLVIRYIHIQFVLIVWAVYIVVSSGIKTISYILAYGYNGFADIGIMTFMEKVTILVLGIVVWVGAHKYVEEHEETGEESGVKGKR